MKYNHSGQYHLTAIRILLLALIALVYITPASSQDFWGKVKGPFTGYVTTMQINSNNWIFLGTWGGGVYRSNDNGLNWTQINTGLANLSVNCMRITANNTIYIGTEGGGIFKTTNNGNTWDSLNTGLTDRNIRAFNISPTGRFYAGTYGRGVFTSSDNGTTWKEANTGLYFKDIITIGFSGNGSYVLAATNGGGIYRSSDNGASWARANFDIGTMFVNQFMVNTAGELMAASNGGGVILSVDNGLSWREFDTNNVDKNITCMVFNSRNDPVVGTRAKGILYYDDMNYENWLRPNVTIGGVTAMAVNSNGELFAAMPFDGIWKSTNYGARWNYLSFKYEQGVKAVGASRISNIVYASFDGKEVFKSEDFTRTWTSVGLLNLGANTIAFDSLDNVYVGTNRGIYKSTNRGGAWTNVGPQDSIITCMAINSSGAIFAGGTRFYKSMTGTAPWTISSLGGEAESVYGITLLPNGTLFGCTGGFGVYKSTNQGTNWTLSLSTTVCGACYDLAINPLGWVYVGAFEGVYHTTNGGQNWLKDTVNAYYPNVNCLGTNIVGTVFAGMDYGEGCYHVPIGGSNWDSTNASFSTGAILDFGHDGQGFTYMGTDILYKSAEPLLLPIPELVSHSDDTSGIPIKTQLSWKSNSRAELYELQVSDTNTFALRAEFVVQADTFRVLEKTLDYNKIYYWRVRTKVHSALGLWSPVRKFRTVIAPPTLVSPANGQKGVKQTDTYVWNKVSGAAEYRIDVAKDTVFANIVFTKNKIKDTTVQVSGLEPLTTYYWRVRAENGVIIGAWSERWSFLTVLAPPNLRAPANHSKDLPTTIVFTWDSSKTAVKYFIQISRKSDFSDNIFYGQTENLRSHTFTLLQYDTKYWWRVQAANDDGYSLFSESWDFQTGIAPPTLISPDSASLYLEEPLRFKWTSYKLSTSHHLQISKDSLFKTIAWQDSALTAEEVEVSGLTSFENYYWRVRDKIDNKPGFWSVVWNFTTKLGVPIQRSPENGAIDQPRDLYLKWDALNGAEKYHIQVASDSLFIYLTHEFPNQQNNQQGLTDLEYNKTYYWRLKAINSVNDGEWTPIWSFTVVDGVSVNEVYPGLTCQVFPNPTEGICHISLGGTELPWMRISVFNELGIEVTQLANVQEELSTYEISWDPAGLPQGSYFIKFESRDFVKVIRLLYIR